MSLSSLQLDAFKAVARLGSFSRAAETLFITQSALSQRVKNLENDLGVSLFIRESSGVKITEIGKRFLRYCQIKETLEDELLFNLKTDKEGELAGLVRIGTFSSILRSVIIPSLGELMRNNPKVQIDFIHNETQGLLELLTRGEADFIISDSTLNIPGIEQKVLGYEEYVVIESSHYNTPSHIYLDNGPEDQATEHFFHFQAKSPRYQRLFMGETYGILAGVEQGLGRAVMPIHLMRQDRDVKIVSGYKKYKRAITLHYHKQNYYPNLFMATINEFEKKCSAYLNLV